MCTTNIISINFELGLGVNGGFVTKQNIFIRLVRISFLCVPVNQYFPVKYPCTVIYNHPFVKLIAKTIWCPMLNHGMIIGVMIFLHYI